MTILNILVHKDGATAVSKQVTEDEAARIAQDFVVQVDVDGAFMDYRDYVAMNSDEPAAEVEEQTVTDEAVSDDADAGDTSTADSLQVEVAEGDGVTGDTDAAVTDTAAADAGSGE